MDREPHIQIRPGDAPRMTMVPAPETLEPVLDFIAQTLEEWGVPMKRANQIQLASDELYSNIVNYSSAGEASITLSRQDGSVTVSFEDNGRAYDPTAREDPDVSTSPEEREEGGLGIFLVKNLASFLGYRRENDTNLLTVCFDYN